MVKVKREFGNIEEEFEQALISVLENIEGALNEIRKELSLSNSREMIKDG